MHVTNNIKLKIMRKIKIIFKTILVLSVLFVTSCEDLTELNTNPNAVTIESANLNLMLTTVLTRVGEHAPAV